MSARAMFPLQVSLRTAPTADPRSRSLALGAVDEMLSDSARAGVLLDQVRQEVIKSPGTNLRAGRAAVLARQAYEARTNAEVAKYRAAYALMAEQEGNKAAAAQNLASQVKTAKQHGPLVERVKYHEKRRDLMLQASAATSKALKRIPPLPEHITKEAATLPSNQQLLASPTLGWKAPALNRLTGNFFPDDVRAAAGALQGFGDDASPSGWWTSLQSAVGFGVKAAGEAAAQEGQKTATQNPTGGNALEVGGGILSTLSNMIGGQTAVVAAPLNTGTDWGGIALVGGVVTLGGFILWKLHKGR